MNKSQLIKAVAEKSELSQKQIGETWKLFEQTCTVARRTR